MADLGGMSFEFENLSVKWNPAGIREVFKGEAMQEGLERAVSPISQASNAQARADGAGYDPTYSGTYLGQGTALGYVRYRSNPSNGTQDYGENHPDLIIQNINAGG